MIDLLGPKIWNSVFLEIKQKNMKMFLEIQRLVSITLVELVYFDIHLSNIC